MELPLTFGHAGRQVRKGMVLRSGRGTKTTRPHSPPDGEAMRVICYMGQTVIDPEQG
jgi:hypothetical protein